jgi:hypothetical protein
VVVIPPRVTGELPGSTPRIQAVYVVVRPGPEAMAVSAASSRARRGWRLEPLASESSEKADSGDW